jgi:MFS transporter, putative metabolite:H+ symporter
MAVPPSQPVTVQQVIDNAALTPRYWRMAIAVLFSEMLEYFDFFLIGFVVSLIAKPWHLTYGASAVLLLSSGVGAIVGSMLWGYLSDRWGRRPMLIAAIAAAAIGTGASAATPTGAWWFLAVFRFVVGVGVGGSVVTGSPLIIELTPTRHRTLLGGFMTSAFIPIGTLVASGVSASLSEAIGFRGLLLVGLAPAVVGLLAFFVVPESPLWLESRGRLDDAARVATRLYQLPATPSLVRPAPRTGRELGYRDTLAYRRSFWSIALIWLFADTAAIGFTLWAPTLMVQVMSITPARAAAYLTIAAACGLVGRIVISLLARAVGRRVAGTAFGVLAGALFTLTGLFHGVDVGFVSFFLIGILVTYFFTDGIFANIVPFTAEVWPSALRSHGSGIGNAMGGVGKIVGPVGLALIVGTSDVIAPKATEAGLLPGFALFGACMLITGVVFAVLAPEPHGKPLGEVAGEVGEDAAGQPGAAEQPTSTQHEPSTRGH